jgi:hypothetical protein
MCIYLYKKTHNKTGLQYLGKTTSKNPQTYKGSGTRWKNHINHHGYDVTTEILKECQTNEEVRYWGRYYSERWNIVDDENWANLKPEEGDGGTISAESNEKRKRSIKKRYADLDFRERQRTATLAAITSPEAKRGHQISMKRWANDPLVKLKRARTLQTYECKRRRSLTEQNPETKARRKLAQKLSQNRPEVKQKLSGPNNYKYDATLYTFIHIEGIMEKCTGRELINKYKLQQSCVSLLIRGKARSHKGWRLLPTL